MSYKDSNTNWKFTVPQEGEVDMAQTVRESLEEVDTALLTPDNKAQLNIKGTSSSTITDTTYVKDTYQTALAGKDVYTTSLHYHPTPKRVPLADLATEADHAKNADLATKAQALTPGGVINGYTFTGVETIQIGIDDIKDAPRTYCGTVEPAQYPGFPDTIVENSLYVMYYD